MSNGTIIWGPCPECPIGMIRDVGNGPECGVCGGGDADD